MYNPQCCGEEYMRIYAWQGNKMLCNFYLSLSRPVGSHLTSHMTDGEIKTQNPETSFAKNTEEAGDSNKQQAMLRGSQN